MWEALGTARLSRLNASLSLPILVPAGLAAAPALSSGTRDGAPLLRAPTVASGAVTVSIISSSRSLYRVGSAPAMRCTIMKAYWRLRAPSASCISCDSCTAQSTGMPSTSSGSSGSN